MKYKKEIVITIIISLLIIFLKYINIFQVENGLGKNISLVLMIIFFSFITIKVQNMIDNNYKDNKINYDSLDILKFIAAILIIILHLRPFKNYSNIFDITFNNIITRTCVPIFFVITGYFIAKKSIKDKQYIKKYIRNIISTYLIWSLIYIPIIIGVIIVNWSSITPYIPNLPIYLFIPLIIILVPFALLIPIFYSGVYYHLWYFPAVILSLVFLYKWNKKFSIRSLLILSFILLLFGATETYYGVLPLTIKQILTYYYNIFFTTRNFLFFGLFYVTLGFYMGSKEKLYDKYCFAKFIAACFLLVFEAIFLHDTKRIDSNILISCIPVTYYLFISIVYISKGKKINFSFRNYSKYYYLIHPMIIFILTINNVLDKIKGPFKQILLVLVITHIISMVIIKINNNNKLII